MSSETDVTTEAQTKIARLERRLAREREARRQAEEISERGMRDLWFANRELDERVEERTRTLADALAQLERASSARDGFLSTLSHEIRTPLNGVVGMLELIETHVSGDQGRRYVEAASESADRLHVLVSRLLDLVELDSGRFSIAPKETSIAALGNQVQDKWQRVALQSRHLLAVNAVDHVVRVDEDRVLQIVDELIDNALTHADPGAVLVEFELVDSSMEIRVRDSGPGLDAARIPELFGDFSMVDSSTARNAQGLGLGLGISRRIAEAMNGTLIISSDGAKSIAALRIPSAPEPADVADSGTKGSQ